jgi:C1A family cysteine protease
VAYAWKQYLQSDPVRHGTLLEEPFLYELCQKYDQWAGEDYDGTSVRAGAKILRNLGYIQSYHWARTIGEIQDWLKTTGPVVLGTYWYTDMFYPDDDGLVTATGQAAGGHAYICVGYNVRKKEFLCVNSWGRDWGRRGKFKIGAVDLQKLLNKHGEACVALESSV